MPPPSLRNYKFTRAVPLFKRAHDLLHTSVSFIARAGEYQAVEAGRDYEGRHDPQAGDGYFFRVDGPDGVEGWQWGVLLDFHESDADDEREEPDVGPPVRFTGSYALGSTLRVRRVLRAWPTLNLLQEPGGADRYRELPAGSYRIDDAIVLPDEGVDGVGDVEPPLPTYPVMYRLRQRGVMKSGQWIPEAFLPGARRRR